MGDLSHHDLCDVLGDADYALRSTRLADDELPSMTKLAIRITGNRVRARADMKQHRAKLARLYERWIIYHQPNLPEPLLRFLIAHEVGEYVYRERGYDRATMEARCNAFGAACCAPRDAMRRAVARNDHGVYALARELAVPQSVAVLRLGEVFDRPVVLLRESGPIVRGAPFVWPKVDELRATVKKPPRGIHPLKIVDTSEERWALMADRLIAA